MMEQRSEIFRRLNTNRKQSILLEQEVDGRLISFRIRKPSIYDFEETTPSQDQIPMLEMGSGAVSIGEQAPSSGEQIQSPGGGSGHLLANVRPDEANVRRMHTALSLNELILRRSKAAKLVIVNLPGAPKESTPEAENNCKCALQLCSV